METCSHENFLNFWVPRLEQAMTVLEKNPDFAKECAGWFGYTTKYVRQKIESLQREACERHRTQIVLCCQALVSKMNGVIHDLKRAQI